ncbi:hypothetical protein [Leptolyngbya sp. GGD]|uniref:hypothetical protein n=1 Tax=Leptolyngbya sp. GGD TaxID=2997907 RepID=UPI00227B1B68|nr:hypothetical protein [Leptolyngbya sp. GGD]MCY6493923.1 hypothetical protein [Leptolyngbya sp. GGD]
MSNSATFELETAVEMETVTDRVSRSWHGFGYDVSVYSYPEFNNRIFCTLDYVYGYPEEEAMLREVVDYLLSIASMQKIYYYRCADFAPLPDDAFPTPEITVDDLFQEEFRPSLGASIMQKFLLHTTYA